MLTELKTLLERLVWKPSREGQMVMVDSKGLSSTDADYAEGNMSNSTFGVYNYYDPDEDGVGDVLSDRLTRAGIHNFRFNTSEMLNTPNGWRERAVNLGGNATLLVLASGTDGSVHRFLTMAENPDIYVAHGTWRDVYWGVMSGSVPDSNLAYLCSRNSAGFTWLSNRKSANALVAQAYGGRKLYLSPMLFPTDLNLAEALVNITSMTGLVATNKLQIRIHEADPLTPAIGQLVGRGLVDVGTVVGVKKVTLVRGDGSAGPIRVYAGRAYWVGISIDNVSGIQLSALPVADRTVLAAADEADLLGTAARVCTEMIMVTPDGGMGGTFPSINELVVTPPPFVGFKPTF